MNKILSLAALLLAASSAGAQNTAKFQLSFVPKCDFIPNMALEPADSTIQGLSLNLPCGRNRQEGATLGFVNIITGESHGFAVGGINVADSYRGFHLGILNFCSAFNGCQLGLFNLSIESHRGAQIGLLNQAGDFSGLQLGAFNYADKVNGLQIGILSVNAASPLFTDFPRSLAPVFPFVNWSF